MIEATTAWHIADKELPKKSCEVVVVKYSNGKIYDVTLIDYSFKNKLFCCVDDSSDEIIRGAHKFSKDVVCWAYLEEFAKSLENKEKRGEK